MTLNRRMGFVANVSAYAYFVAALLTMLFAFRITEPIASAQVEHERPFRILVRDAQTQRGVPLVELTTTNGVTWITDNAGIIAFHEPGLMNTRVHFTVRAHGHTYPADAFDIRGIALDITPGGRATIDLDRVNIAERLYRVTGSGLYRDSILLNEPVPIRQPLVNGLVNGQDSVQSVIYKGRIFWIWGDTSRPAYPLGNFHASGAMSNLPDSGGLDPAVGINLDYFVDEKGFSRPMCPMQPKPGPVWMDGFMVWRDDLDREHFYTHYVRVKTLGELYERGIVRYNDQTQIFEPVASFDIDSQLHPMGHPIQADVQGRLHFLFGAPFINRRVPADADAIIDPKSYEAFTCFQTGSLYDADTPRLDRDEHGRLIYGWKRHAPPIDQKQLLELIQAESIASDESWFDLRDVETGKPILVHGGSVYWNEHRKQWIAIILQSMGEPSFLGEIWYAQAPTPVGPWMLARRIVTHDQYSFYNPKHHPFFNQQGGRVVYFEGTYTQMFSAAKAPTPRYDYNQIMYRLDLDDPRLIMPEPVYRLESDSAHGPKLAMLASPDARQRTDEIDSIAFLAYPPDRAPQGTVPIAISEDDFVHVWPTDDDTFRPGFVPLFRWIDGAVSHLATTVPDEPGDWSKDGEALGFVWPVRMKSHIVRAIMANNFGPTPQDQ